METTVHSNGSGETLPIEALFARLFEEVLDPSFEAYGDFVDAAPQNMAGEPLLPPGGVSFFGNFYNYSHVFQIDTTDPELIERLTAAIRANQARPEYAQAKTEIADRERLECERIATRDRARQEKAEREARATLGIAA